MSRGHFHAGFLVLAALSGLVAAAHAQHVRPGQAQPRTSAARTIDPKDWIRIRKIEGLGTRSLKRTPDYNARTNVPGGTKPARAWGMIHVLYDTAPEWIDELVFQYYAMAERREAGVRRYTLYKATVRYADIEKGTRHMSAVFLRPSALRRYGDVGAVAVEVLHGGKVIAEAGEQSIQGLPREQWWREPRVVESKAVTVKDGYLLDKSKTPFVFVNIDDYEDIK